jgi:hypothetical protein
MARYCLQTNQVKGIKKALKKWGKITVDDDLAKGCITIKNVRKYNLHWEADVEFDGTMFLKYAKVKEFYTSEVKNYRGVSKIKLNRIMRKYLYNHITFRLKYFEVDIRDYYNIKKITWL